MPEETFPPDRPQALAAADLIISLERALDQKDMLLDEVQHRIRNSLSLVTSLLNLQAWVTRALAEQIGGRLRRLGCGGCAQVLRFSPPAA